MVMPSKRALRVFLASKDDKYMSKKLHNKCISNLDTDEMLDSSNPLERAYVDACVIIAHLEKVEEHVDTEGHEFDKEGLLYFDVEQLSFKAYDLRDRLGALILLSRMILK